MFGKSDLVDSLNRDLARARNKRDALASGVATLTAQIAELETRLSAENERRERERAASEIEGIKKRVRDGHLAFAPAIAGIRDATEVAAAIVPEAREFNDLLEVIATEVANAIDGLLGDLDRRIEAVRAGGVAPELPRSLNGSPELPQNGDRLHRLPEWLPRREPTKEELAEDQSSRIAAA
jgi:outer membrane murein-binding lipoprotein Lpp